MKDKRKETNRRAEEVALTLAEERKKYDLIMERLEKYKSQKTFGNS
jgi:hypothetical protein